MKLSSKFKYVVYEKRIIILKAIDKHVCDIVYKMQNDVYTKTQTNVALHIKRKHMDEEYRKMIHVNAT